MNILIKKIAVNRSIVKNISLWYSLPAIEIRAHSFLLRPASLDYGGQAVG